MVLSPSSPESGSASSIPPAAASAASSAPPPLSANPNLVALGQVLKALREGDRLEALMATSLDYLQTYLPYDTLWFALYDPQTHQLVGQQGVLPQGDPQFLKHRHALEAGDLFDQAITERKPLALPNLTKDRRVGRWREQAQQSNIQGALIFPLNHRDRCCGVVLLGSSQWGLTPQAADKAQLSMLLGELASAVVRVEQSQQQQKRPDQPLLALLAKLQSLPNLGARLTAILDESHRFIQPARLSLYWFDPQQRCFWARLTSNRNSGTRTGQPTLGISAQDLGSFYQALSQNQLVEIQKSQHSGRVDPATRILQGLGAKALLAAPILYEEQMLGFLAAEGPEGRGWSEPERHYLQGAAQMMGLVMPLEQVETTVTQLRQDHQITTEIARSIHSREDWNQALRQAAQQVSQRLSADRFVLLTYDRGLQRFEVAYQGQPSARKALPSHLAPLSEMDWQMLEQSQGAIAIEDIADDLRLMAWREVLLQAGIGSVIAMPTGCNPGLEGLVLAACDSPRRWDSEAQTLLAAVGQQLGLLLHQWHLHQQVQQQHTIDQALQQIILSMQQTQPLSAMQQMAVAGVAELMQVPMAVLLHWLPGQPQAIVTSHTSHVKCGLNARLREVPLSDPLLASVVQSRGIWSGSVADLPPQTQQWLQAPELDQVIALALVTASSHEPTGVLLVGDRAGRVWSEARIQALRVVTQSLAWSRRYQMLGERLAQGMDTLERLNWYKHRCLQESMRSLSVNLNKLEEVTALTELDGATLRSRQQQILQQIRTALTPLNPILTEEQWQLQNRTQMISLISLLKRTLERVDDWVKRKQLWAKVHDESRMSIPGDSSKIEHVLYEVLLFACGRSSQGGRIDIWCRQLDAQWLEIGITDDGQLDLQMLNASQPGDGSDRLEPLPVSALSAEAAESGLNPAFDPRHLLICRSILRGIGGDLSFHHLDDGRAYSRLVLPIAVTAEPRREPSLKCS
jgi:GAF domain-containing protein